MLTPVTLAPGVIFDGRSIILAIAGLFGGPIAAGVAVIVASVLRLSLAGVGTGVGVGVIFEAALIGLAFRALLRKGRISAGPATLWGLGMAVHVVMLLLMYALPGGIGGEILQQIAVPVLLTYPLAFFVVATLLLDQEQRLKDEAELRILNESLETQVAERTQALSDINVRLAAESDAKTRFLRSMSHELRTPLNSIIGFSDILGKGMAGELNEEQQRQIDMIGGAGKHLLALINDILDLSRIEANAVKVEREEIAVHALVSEIVATLAPEVEAKGISLISELETADMTMISDSRKLSQILLNLTSNAVKFTERGSVTLRLHHTGNTVTFSVEDTGPGIPAEQLDSIFSEFTRGERTPDQSADGTGLGLAISRGLAEMLGGRIEVQSEVGRGSIFTLTLPVTP
jgi:signal transduction histidine kinase